MNCEEFESRLNDVLDERASPQLDAALAGHAAECPPCADRLACCEMWLPALAELPAQPRCSELLGHRVLAELGPAAEIAVERAAPVEPARTFEPVRTTATRAGLRWLPWAAAAAVLVGAGVYRLATLPPAAAPQPLPPVVAQKAPPVVEPAPVLPPVMAAERRGEYLALARVTERVAEEYAAGQTVWVEPVANRLEPVRSSMESALESLRRSLSVADPGPRDS